MKGTGVTGRQSYDAMHPAGHEANDIHKTSLAQLQISMDA
jgi:hypothetical protein